MPSVLIVEDHTLFREVIRKICIQDLKYDVIGEVESVELAIQKVLEKAPDIVILDLALSDGEGFEVMEKAAERALATKFVVISAYCTPFSVFRVQRSIASAFVDKNTSTISQLADALTAVSNGLLYFSAAFREISLAIATDRRSFFHLLTDAELIILNEIVYGANNEELAASFGLSPKTVKTHRGNILRKLGISSTPKLVAFIANLGMPIRFSLSTHLQEVKRRKIE